MEGFGDATLSRTRSARLSEYRRKYSDALAASSPPSGSGAPPGTTGGAHALHYQGGEGGRRVDRLMTQVRHNPLPARLPAALALAAAALSRATPRPTLAAES